VRPKRFGAAVSWEEIRAGHEVRIVLQRFQASGYRFQENQSTHTSEARSLTPEARIIPPWTESRC
jgi:hypothetical protein